MVGWHTDSASAARTGTGRFLSDWGRLATGTSPFPLEQSRSGGRRGAVFISHRELSLPSVCTLANEGPAA
jgi:hypothetical protein